MKIIDAHTHIGKGFEKCLEPEELISIMDANKVCMSVICPIEQYITVYCEEGNRYILEQTKKYPGRFIGFASINPWYGDKGLEILKKYLDLGLKGLKLNPKLQGFRINSSLVKPFVKLAESYGVPVYFHTGTPMCAEPFQLRELAMEFPKVNFIMGHSGNTDFWTDVEYSVKDMQNIYLETSHNMGIDSLISFAGADNVIFGSNMPRSHQSHELGKIFDLGLSVNDLEKVLSLNISRLTGGVK